MSSGRSVVDPATFTMSWQDRVEECRYVGELEGTMQALKYQVAPDIQERIDALLQRRRFGQQSLVTPTTKTT